MRSPPARLPVPACSPGCTACLLVWAAVGLACWPPVSPAAGLGATLGPCTVPSACSLAASLFCLPLFNTVQRILALEKSAASSGGGGGGGGGGGRARRLRAPLVLYQPPRRE